jgi:hypothetical protein
MSIAPGIFGLPEQRRLCLAPFQYGKTLILPSDVLFALCFPFSAANCLKPDNHRAGCQNQRGTGTTLRARTMSMEENLTSASDETESNDEVHRSGMPTRGLGF